MGRRVNRMDRESMAMMGEIVVNKLVEAFVGVIVGGMVDGVAADVGVDAEVIDVEFEVAYD
jgi:hypothetical protein